MMMKNFMNSLIDKRALGFTVVLGASVAWAQEPPRPSDPELSFNKSSQLTTQEQLTQAGNYLTRMQETLNYVTVLSDRARKEKDIIKLNCVNDKLIQIKGTLRLAEQFRDALRMAANSGDENARNHEFSKLTITYQKVVVLQQEAEACAGEEIAYVGATRVELDVDPEITQSDPTVTSPSPFTGNVTGIGDPTGTPTQ